jgi:uncharacterized caspase-like protein
LRRTVLLFFSVFCLSPALADDRVALVIGNSEYRNVPWLGNPTNDAAAISALFKAAGYAVRTYTNLQNADMRRVIREFSDDTANSDIAVLYFAGHGMELGGQNYLVPTDAMLKRDVDVEDETIGLERILKVLEPARRLRLVILDASRDSPFSSQMRRVVASRSIGRGLAKVEPTTSDTLVAFAARAGSVAEDGLELHSPFTTALLNHLGEPGTDVRISLGKVRDEVIKSTRGRQEPFVYGSLGGSTMALVSNQSQASVEKSDTLTGSPIWREYEAAEKIGTRNAWDAFISAHPTGIYSELARERVRALSKQGLP